MDPIFAFILYYGSALVATIILAICIFQLAICCTYPNIIRSKNEEYFTDPITNSKTKFPNLNDNASIQLSVIIPAYNEGKRLGSMLDECIKCLEAKMQSQANFLYEIILVSDGSRDDTVLVAQKYAKKLDMERFRILDLEKNRGKGGAVRLGMDSARGALLLFADADGATRFSDIEKLERSMNSLLNVSNYEDLENVESRPAIVIGSRSHLEHASIATRSVFRTILMYAFHFLVWLFAVRGIKDTQCGFKLFTRKAARMCFDSLHVERWAFDVELLYIAQTLKIPINEVAVNWTEIDGSKITPFWSWIQMGCDLILIWLRYTIGAWKIYTKEKNQ